MTQKRAIVYPVDTLNKVCANANIPEIEEGEGIMLVVCSKQGYIRAHVLALGIMTEGRLEMSQMTLYKALIAARARATSNIPEGMMDGDNVVV